VIDALLHLVDALVGTAGRSSAAPACSEQLSVVLAQQPLERVLALLARECLRCRKFLIAVAMLPPPRSS
jgi:hypothetical protein